MASLKTVPIEFVLHWPDSHHVIDADFDGIIWRGQGDGDCPEWDKIPHSTLSWERLTRTHIIVERDNTTSSWCWSSRDWIRDNLGVEVHHLSKSIITHHQTRPTYHQFQSQCGKSGLGRCMYMDMVIWIELVRAVSGGRTGVVFLPPIISPTSRPRPISLQCPNWWQTFMIAGKMR